MSTTDMIGVMSVDVDRAMLVCVALLIWTITWVDGEQYASFVKLANIDSKLEEYLPSSTKNEPTPITTCLSVCQKRKDCVFVSYHDGQQLCHLHGLNKTAVTSLGGSIYFKQLDEEGETEMDLRKDATAYQSSTSYIFTADLAIDGNTNTDFRVRSCSHTDNLYSYWIMQFGISGVVGKVEMYMRSDLGLTFHDWTRNTNRTVIVAQTYDDAVSSVGRMWQVFRRPDRYTAIYTGFSMWSSNIWQVS